MKALSKYYRIVLFSSIVAMAFLFVTSGFADHTSKKFEGPKANTGTVTHSKKGGQNILTLSDDFIVPNTPAPHWQVVDSKGHVYLLNRLKIKGDKYNKSITVPSFVKDISKVQIWCAFAETLLGEASFEYPVGAASSEVTYFENKKVAAAFAKGAPLIEVSDYKVHASHREGGGQSEVHMYETDIFYVLKGSATFVTGGTIVDGKTTAPGEIRGSAISGGETRHITKGDVIIIPAGTPHWFKEVNGTIDYYVVKVLKSKDS